MVLEGDAADLYDLRAVPERQAEATGQDEDEVALLPFYNPPFVAGALALLATLPLPVSAAVFTLLSLAALAVAMRLLLGPLRLEAPERFVWVLAVLASMPFFYTLLHGQFSFLLLLLFTAVYVFLKRGRDDLAGASLALLLLKPPLVLLPLAVLVINRRSQALGGFLATAVVLAVASLLVGGPSSVIAYPGLLIQAATWDGEAGIAVVTMFGWNAFFKALAGPESFLLASALAAVASLITIALALRALKLPWNPRSAAFDQGFALLILAVLVTSPHLYGQDLVLVLIPAALLYGAAADARGRYLVLGFVLAGWFVMHRHFHILEATDLNLVTVLLFGLFLVARAQLAASTQARAPAEDLESARVLTRTAG